MSSQEKYTAWLDPEAIDTALTQAKQADKKRQREILAKAAEKKGLTIEESAVLMEMDDPEILGEMFTLAKKIKEEIYGRRIVLFAPMYISNHCKNECLYCAFRASNKELKRRALTMEEIALETRLLVNQGHKRTLMVAGESYPDDQGFEYILKAIETIYSVQGDKPGANIRRVNVNLAPVGINAFKKLEEAKIGTFQVFQETYDRKIYAELHKSGRKADFDWRVTAMHRAMEAGLGDVGVGVLYGLADWRFDSLSLLQHIADLDKTFGIGCHTISVPRLEPAHGSSFATSSPHAVNDNAFKKIVAVLRLAVPYTGMIMSTRENEQMRQETLELGVSQISAGSRTNPGGYAEAEATERFDESQFQLGDHRSLDEVVLDLAERGFIPSNCTACDQLGRMGAKFMPFAKSGKIKNHCTPNALSTFEEYLIDYATPQTKQAGCSLIEREMSRLSEGDQRRADELLKRVKQGERECLC
ncbi:MAG: [FeFe] hydrogenase H-cluster radical SAM maturase HydG [Bdellovibrionales bacterium]